MVPIEGDAILEVNEEDLNFYSDAFYIDQARQGVNVGGKMSRKRTLHDLRAVAKARQSEYWARLFDEQFFMYLSGARGINSDYIFPTSYTGRANNAFTAPDSQHLIVAGSGTKAALTSSDGFTLGLIDRALTKAVMMGGGTQGTPQIQPIMVDGEEHYVVVVSPYQIYQLRTASGSQWLDLQKAAAAAVGLNSPIFKGTEGMYNNVVIHKHKSVIRFSDYGASNNLAAARALFLGEQAAVCAFGSSGSGMRFDWHEEMEDRGNQLVVTTSSIFGIKKCSFNSVDFGVMAIDTYAPDPG
jgi:N4-gp56 family major capsid protein